MILNGILRYGAHFKGISVISENLELLSLSVAEISAKEETLVAPFYFVPRGSQYIKMTESRMLCRLISQLLRD